jgi:membrane protease YdiL (CAAX protease family)
VSQPSQGDPPAARHLTGRLLLGLVVVWLLFERVAEATKSHFGEAGLLIASIVGAGVLLAERLLFGRPPGQAARAVGLGRPAARGLAAAAAVSALMLACFPAFAWLTGTSLRMRPDWWLLLPGLFAQAGIAEELLFRGYLFGHLREGRSFWRAALLSVPPFLAVHLLLFLKMDVAVAAAALVVSLVISFPLARLYDLGGGTIWGAAILHWVVQGAIKLVLAPDESRQLQLSLAWMGLSLLVPWLVFAFASSRREVKMIESLPSPAS